jgi:hypothetical protein
MSLCPLGPIARLILKYIHALNRDRSASRSIRSVEFSSRVTRPGLLTVAYKRIQALAWYRRRKANNGPF